jgi:hypothetical protein
MTKPTGGKPDAHIRVYEDPHAIVEITGETEAGVLRRAADWLESLDGAVVVISANWRGDTSEDSDDKPCYRMDLTVDMSLAVHEGRWPHDWFQPPR